jgi:diphthamide synthase subunit DPH2
MLFVVTTLLIASTCSAADKCSDADAQVAETTTGLMKTWPAIYSGFTNYGRCDDGGIAEGFTEAVVHLLASKWYSLPKAVVLVKKDPAFRTFFLKHIDASADTDELRKIKILAQSQCPAHLRELCTAIQASAEKAISESPNVP